MLEKAYITANRPLKAILVRAQKKKSCRESLSLPKEHLSGLDRMLVERWTVKAILMRSPMEMRNMLLETEGKAILVKKQQRTRLYLRSCPSILWKIELVVLSCAR